MSDELVNGVTEESGAPAPQPVIDAVEADVTPAEAKPGFWAWARALLFGEDRQRRLDALNEAIARSESAPSNYVLRGELYLEMGEYAAALADFEYAEKMAAYQINEESWGIISQAMRDRALVGITKAKRRLNNAQGIEARQVDGHEQDSHDYH